MAAKKATFPMKGDKMCTTCAGTGKKGGKACASCGGSGKKR
jgi:DnaJ-class molecular chaperone